ncbi:WD repeat-containing protein 41 [Plakobranchus ocellatus]|uniref:WD repeat-containing protein 41 n=1 Tax=Plakobranchus ocellatus TaxID=259542 RepID=A0AAV4AF14_9GAST|nr:WD repeat-containing protein 41 [Plakobranchus ocellatus]
MALLQRLLSSEKIKREEVDEPCEEVEEGQPNNPYTEILLLQHHTDIVRILLRISDKRFVSAGDDSRAVIWDIQTGQRIAVLTGHSHPITCLLHLQATGPGGQGGPLIISGSPDKQIRIWNADTGACLHILSDHGASVRCLQMLSDELVCAGGENVSLWNRHGQMLHCIKSCANDDYVSLMIAVKNERIVTAAGKDLIAYRLDQGRDNTSSRLVEIKQMDLHREAILSLCVISTSCFASGSVDGTIIIWAASTLQATKKITAVADGEAINNRFSHSIQAMLCVQERYVFAGTGYGFFAFDVSTDKEKIVVQKRRAHLSKITCLGLACGGEFLATCSEDKCLRLWGRKPSGDPWQDGVALTPMERFTGVSSSELNSPSSGVWEPALLGECCAHGGSVQGFLDFDHEGIVTCGADGLVIIWKNWEMQKVRRNQAVQKLLAHWDGVV